MFNNKYLKEFVSELGFNVKNRFCLVSEEWNGRLSISSWFSDETNAIGHLETSWAPDGLYFLIDFEKKTIREYTISTFYTNSLGNFKIVKNCNQ